MKVDEFLKLQEESGFEIHATIEPVNGKPGYVKVTPYSSGGGCRCSGSIALDANHIENVEPTGTTVWCCGKNLKVAKVVIRKAATVPVADVLARAMQQHGGGDPGDDCVSICADGYRTCMKLAGNNSKQKTICADGYHDCVVNGCGEPDGPLPYL